MSNNHLNGAPLRDPERFKSDAVENETICPWCHTVQATLKKEGGRDQCARCAMVFRVVLKKREGGKG